jgi:hypothetical protein
MIPDLRGIVSLKNISVQFNGEFLFNGISFLVNPRPVLAHKADAVAGIGRKRRHIHLDGRELTLAELQMA